MINLNPDLLPQLRERYRTATPFPYVVIDDFLSPEFADKLAANFPSPEEMNVKYQGFNEQKGEHSVFSSLAPEFTMLKNKLSSPDFVCQLEEITGINDLFTIDDRFGRGLHQGARDSFLDTHIDYNLHPTLKKQRRFNFILFLSKDWKEEWGGCLHFTDQNLKKQAVLVPKFNRAVIFVCNSISFHGYEAIKCPEKITRKSFYTYYFTEPQANQIYHDTVFKPKPNDTVFKKTVIWAKESSKNMVKRVLYYSGLNKYLE